MTANFLEAVGTNGFISAPFALGVFSGGNTVSQLLQTSGSVPPSSFSQTSGTPAQAIWGGIYAVAGAAFTPSAGGYLAGWFTRSMNGGTTFESPIGTNVSLPRSPDFVIPLQALAYASGNMSACQGAYVKLPWESYQVYVQSQAGSGVGITALTIYCGPVAIQY